MKFRVDRFITVVECTTFEVEADDEEHAIALAMEQYDLGDEDSWHTAAWDVLGDAEWEVEKCA